MVYTTVGICQVQPAHRDGAMLSMGFTEGSGKFSGLLCAPRYYRHESLLDTSIDLTIGYHSDA